MAQPSTIEIQCNQRNKYQNIIIPSSRFEMLNPYIGSQFSPFDFDMRRKAEILKYSNNASNSKTNNDTTNQYYSRLVKTISKDRSYSKSSYIKNIYIGDLEGYLDFYIIPSAINYSCNTTNIVKTPSSNSNVPGNIELYEDKSVPLYKYKDFNNYAVVADAIAYNILINSDINYLVIEKSQPTQAYYLYSNNAVTNSTQLTLKIPISLYVKGVASANASIQNGDNISQQLSFTINYIDFSLHYNPELYDGLSSSRRIGPNRVDVNKEITIDISFQYQDQDTDNNHFQYIKYLDTIDVSIENIDTSNKFIYDIYVETDIADNVNSIISFDTSYGIIFNVEDNYDVSVNTSTHSINPDPLNNGYANYQSSSNNAGIVETIFKNKYFADLNTLSQTTYQEQIDISENIALTKYSYVDVENYYNNANDVHSNVYILKQTKLTNTIYNVQDIRYNPNVYYTLTNGIYYFVNIPTSHPIAILNQNLVDGNSNYLIAYSNNNDAGYNQYTNGVNNNFNNTQQYQVGPLSVDVGNSDPENGDYIFMYGTVKVEVVGDFDKASIYCYNHGFMGNRYILRYRSY